MKFVYIIAVVMLLLACSPVSAAVETFQDFASENALMSVYSITAAPGGTTFGGIAIRDYVGNGGDVYIADSSLTATSYFAADLWVGGFTYPTTRIDLHNSALTYLGTAGIVGLIGGDGSHPLPVRAEVKIVGGIPMVYLDGVYSASGAAILQNPTYYRLVNLKNPIGGVTTVYIDNIVIGGTDHHVVGSIPTNWSVQRDLLNPASTGVYAWNPNTNAWVLQSSYFFYIDADKESTTAENLYIKRMSDGVIVNTTVLTASRNRVEYNVQDFFADATITDGVYSVGFSGSTNLEYFWVLSSGAVVSFDDDTYTNTDPVVISYAVSSGGYWDTTKYTYNLKVQNIYGTVIHTIPVTTQSGTGTFTFTTEDTPGVYYVILQATDISTGSSTTIGYDACEMTGYFVMEGNVYDAETTNAISGADVKINQGSVWSNSTSTAGGNYTTRGTVFQTGGVITISVTKAGYTDYTNSFTPLVSRTIALDFTLMPTPMSATGLAINGICRDTAYGNPISGASLHIFNSTYAESYNATSNAVGYYKVDLSSGVTLIEDRLYFVYGSKSRFTDSSIYQVIPRGA